MRENAKWLECMVRFGFFAKGAVYCLFGIITGLTVFGIGRGNADRDTVIKLFLDLPIFGKILLAVLALGLLSHAAFRFVQAFYDLDNKGSSAGALGSRMSLAGSGFAYLLFAGYVILLIFELRRASGSDSETQIFFAGKILMHPLGHFFIGLFSMFFFGRALWKGYRAFNLKDEKNLKREDIPDRYNKLIKISGKIGYLSRAVLFAVIGYFFIRAAVYSNPREIKGMKGAFDFLENIISGGWLLIPVAAGLIGYGLFMLIRGFFGKYRLENMFED
jgi:hypothetical protein